MMRFLIISLLLSVPLVSDAAFITDRLHIGNRWLGHLGLAMYDNTARVHDPVMPRMLTCDSRAVDYPGHSPFSHCAGNPANLVDWDGCKPRVYIETQKFGHVFLTTGSGNNTTVYTYGRYGQIYMHSSGGSSPTGEGVLKVLKGDNARKYIEDEVNIKNATIFEFNEEKDSDIDSYFKKLISNSINKQLTDEELENGVVIDDYNIATNNCVTTSLGALQAVGIDVSKIISISPAQLLTKMLNLYKEAVSAGIVSFIFQSNSDINFTPISNKQE